MFARASSDKKKLETSTRGGHRRPLVAGRHTLQQIFAGFTRISGQQSVQQSAAKAALLGARRAPSIAALASAKCFPGAPWWPKTATRWCFTACFGSFLPYIWPTVGPTAPSKGCFAGGPKGPQHSSPSKRKMLPWCPLVAKNCHQMVLYSMFWFVFALYLANGRSNGPQQRLLCWGPEGPPA